MSGVLKDARQRRDEPINSAPCQWLTGWGRGASVSPRFEFASGHKGFQSTIDIGLTDFSDGQVTELIDPESHAAQ